MKTGEPGGKTGELHTRAREDLQSELDALNEQIYEPDEHVTPNGRAAMLERRDRVYEKLRALDGDEENKSPDPA